MDSSQAVQKSRATIKVLVNFYKILKEAGVKPYRACKGDKALIAYLGSDKKPERNVTGSPYWANLVGRDCSNEEAANMVMSLSEEELVILDLGMTFFLLLRQESINKKQLRKMIDPRTRFAWGNFRKAAGFASGVLNPGCSTKIRFSDNGARATIRIWPQVAESFVIDQPQIAEQIEIALVKMRGQWKVRSIVSSSPGASN